MSCRDWEERMALYAGGDAGPAEAAAVERHAAECAGCQALLNGLRQNMELLRGAHREPVEAAHFAAVRARVMEEIGRESKPWWWRQWALGCVVAAAVAMAVLAVRPAGKARREVSVVKSVEAPKASQEMPKPVQEAGRLLRPGGVRVAVGSEADDEKRSRPPLAGQLADDEKRSRLRTGELSAPPAGQLADDERRSRLRTSELSAPLVVKLITDDPDVVIYWITDGRGE